MPNRPKLYRPAHCANASSANILGVRAIALGLGAMALSMGLAGCNKQRDKPDDQEQTAVEQPRTAATDSIFDPGAGVEAPVAELEPLVVLLSFADAGDELSDQHKKQIDAIFDSEQFAEGKPIVLRGHSDASGSTEANMKLSLERAHGVRDYLLSKKVPEKRIIVIGFGAQNPIEPNALPNGEPNEAGRKANRRVELVVTVTDPQGEEEPTLVEQVANASEEDQD